MGTLRINEREVSFQDGQTILEVALENGIYIPHLCTRRGLPSPKGLLSSEIVYRGEKVYRGQKGRKYEGCGLCVVQIEGGRIVESCVTKAEDGAVVYTNTPEIVKRRRENLRKILEKHPHGCLLCPQREGCDRKTCSFNVPEEERCCWKFGACELEKLAEYVGIEGGLPSYRAQREIVNDNPFFLRDYNYCIGCLRCVVACKEIVGAEALGFVWADGEIVVGFKSSTAIEAGCRFCGICVDVCPTGALRHKESKVDSKRKAVLPSTIYPPERWLPFTEENIMSVPEEEGVYQLYDEQRNLYKVIGTENLKKALLEEIESGCRASYFTYEEDLMYTSRERQIIQQYVKKHGRLPPGNDEMEELF